MLITRVRRYGGAAGIALPVFRIRGDKWPTFITAFALCTCIQSALAQSVSGSIAGNIRNGIGVTIETEQVGTGARRLLTPSIDHYSVTDLAPGEYIVRVTKEGKIVTIKRLVVTAGVAATLDIDVSTTQANTLDTVNVKAAAPSPIDVSSPFSSFIMRKQDLKNLPISQSFVSISNLLSNVRSASATGTPLPAFNGATPAENRHYINGFDATYDEAGLGYTGPSAEILETTEVISHGFSAKYGNAVGGVTSDTTKSGTNNLHGGTVLTYTPATGRLNPNGLSVAGPSNSWFTYTKANHEESRLTQSVYLSGPLIRDRLFFNIVGGTTYPSDARDVDSNLRFDTNTTSKNRDIILTWHISERQSLNVYNFRNTSRTATDFISLETRYDLNSKSTYQATTLNKSVLNSTIANYQWNITDSFYVKAMGGYIRRDQGSFGSYYDIPYVTMVVSPSQSIWLNGVTQIKPDDRIYTKRGYRLDFGWEVGDHTISFGGEWYRTFLHDKTSFPNNWLLLLVPDSGIVNEVSGFTPGSYFAMRYKSDSGGNFDATKSGIYIEDTWRVTDNFKLYLGLRRDSYNNSTSAGSSFAKMGINEPRLGVVWDIDGNGERKLSASLGRYALQLPLSVNKKVGTSDTTNETYYTYTGLGSDSVPIGLTQIGDVHVISDSVVTDARLVSSQNVRPSYSDQFSVTYQQSLGGITSGWLGRAAQGWYGSAVGYVTDLKNTVEDTCEQGKRNSYIKDVLNYKNYAGETVKCILANPGKDEALLRDVDNNGSLERITIPSSYIGISKAKRKSLGLTLELFHPYSNHFYAQLGYTWQHLYGNYDGAMNVTKKSAGDVSTNAAFDLASLGLGATGNLAADIRHSFKGNGYYQWDNGFRLGASAQLYSGRPLNCLGNDINDIRSYSGSRFFCGGVLIPRGSVGRLGWNWSIGLNVGYSVELANNWGAIRFDLSMQNVTNRQGVVDRSEEYENYYMGRLPTYGLPGYQSPRSTWFTARYDF